ncbi:MAG: hypothetical protein ACJ74F_21575 [Mycobacterium sp.]|uniref:hypothetical protein n=1 Tax=Mycobacterium sp. TaxID=1785 RepID=UPI003899B20A
MPMMSGLLNAPVDPLEVPVAFVPKMRAGSGHWFDGFVASVAELQVGLAASPATGVPVWSA